jgi:hypothetical protein
VGSNPTTGTRHTTLALGAGKTYVAATCEGSAWSVRHATTAAESNSAAIVFPARRDLDRGGGLGTIMVMALTRKKATTIALDPEDDRLLTRAARDRGVSRAEFIRQHLALVLEQYRRHPRPRSAGVLGTLPQRGNERELYRGRR